MSSILFHATNFQWANYDQKIAALPLQTETTGLIVGGSNASFGLSAEMMTRLTEKRWFNASLMGEGYTARNQEEFLERIAAAVGSDHIDTIVLSSIRHVKGIRDDKWLDERYGVDGNLPIPAWLPQRSLLNFAVNPRLTFYDSLIDQYGDIDHDVANVCRPREGSAPIRWASERDSERFVRTWLPVLTSVFPKAEVVIVIPSKYVADASAEPGPDEYVARLERQIDQWRESAGSPATAPISVLVEPNVTDRSLVCNTSHHLNAAGREVRTRALVDALAARTTDNR